MLIVFIFLITLVFLYKVINLQFVKYNEPSFLKDKKILTVYYSHGNNTEHIAKVLHSIVGGDIQKINVVAKYPKNIFKFNSLVRKQIEENYIPEIDKIDFTNYDIIFVGSPIWLGDVSLPVRSFFKNNNFDNKTVISFLSYSGGAKREDVKQSIEKLIKENSKNVKVLTPMLTFKGGIILVNKQIENWLNSLGDKEEK